MPPQYTTKDITRFWAKVDKSGDCWLWIASKVTGGYGGFRVRGCSIRAHRFVYELTYGSIPDGLIVCHHCDTPACVRPDHLFLGTQSDNVADRVAKGRSATGDQSGRRKYPDRYAIGDEHWTRKYPERVGHGETHIWNKRPELVRRGEKVNTAKIPPSDIPLIRERYAAGETLKQIGSDYGVHHGTISRIVLRKNWKHID